jgi:hypothetical protein
MGHNQGKIPTYIQPLGPHYPYQEILTDTVEVSTGLGSAGVIPVLGPDRQLDPSLIPGGSGGTGATGAIGPTGPIGLSVSGSFALDDRTFLAPPSSAFAFDDGVF